MNDTKLKLSYLLIGISFFAFVLLRANNIGVTHDEAATITLCDRSLLRVLFFTITANNHILNTALIKLLFLTGNDSLFIARLPSLLSFILYLYFSYKIAYKNLSPITGLGCFLLLSCNPFLLEFFGLARGYGLSLAFMLGSLYFASENVKTFSQSTLSKSLIFGGLSIWAVFSMIYYWAALVLVLNVVAYLKKDKTILKISLKQSLLAGFSTLLLIGYPLLRLIHYNGIYYGGTNNFYSDTLVSLVKHSLLQTYKHETTLGIHIILNIFLLSITYCILKSPPPHTPARKRVYHPQDLFIATTGLTISAIISAHYLVGVRYPIDRVALFLYPLFILCLFFLLKNLKTHLRIIISLSLTLGSLINLISNYNIHKTTLWYYDSHTEDILNKVNQVGELNGEIVKFKYEWPFGPSVHFYGKRNSYPFIEIVNWSKNTYIPAEAGYLLSFSTVEQGDRQALQNSAALDISDLYRNNIFIEYPEEHIIVFDLNKKH